MKVLRARWNSFVLCAGVLVLGWCAAFTPAQDAQSLVKNGDFESGDTTNWQGAKTLSDDAHGGKHSLSVTGNATVRSEDPIPVDPNKSYALTGWFKSAGQEQSKVYLGYAPLDENKVQILPQHVRALQGTETTLAESCRKDDKIIKIADGSKWQALRHALVAFEVDDSGEYKDLPNRKLSGTGITRVEQKGNVWEVELAYPVNHDAEAGTKIREHASGAAYIYNAASSKVVPTEWTQFSGKVGPALKSGTSAGNWWPGTRYAQIVILANHQQKGEATVLIDDIMMTPME